MSRRWMLPPLAVGELAPDFALPTRTNPEFHFSTLPGRYVLLAFMPRDAARRDAAVAAFQAIRPGFDDVNRIAFLVAGEPVSDQVPPDSLPGLRWFFDADGAVRRRFHLSDEDGGWLLFDPMLRLLDRADIDEPEPLFARIAALPPPGDHTGPPLVAPVLIVPRVFEPELCRRLIELYEARGGQLSGVMRDVGGRTVGILDTMKRRRDVMIEDPDLRRLLLSRLERNLVPMVARALQFRATRLERYLVACYDAQEGGYFQPHRDNETFGTAHRRFACTINLNAEDYDGGELRFPEFGRRTYRAPTGGAVVFGCNLQHEATPVTRGRRYAFLPFLYDEAGEQIRQQNLALLDKPAGEPAETR